MPMYDEPPMRFLPHAPPANTALLPNFQSQQPQGTADLESPSFVHGASFTSHDYCEDMSACLTISSQLYMLRGNTDGSPCDLTGQVTRSSSHPVASGGFGDIYRGDLNMGRRLINVRHCSFSLVKLKDH